MNNRELGSICVCNFQYQNGVSCLQGLNTRERETKIKFYKASVQCSYMFWRQWGKKALKAAVVKRLKSVA